LPPPGRTIVVRLPQRTSCTGPHFTFFSFNDSIVAFRSSHMKYSSCRSFFSEECGFRGWQGKNEPAVAGVHRGEFENIPKESAIAFRVLAVDDDVSSVNHRGAFLTSESRAS